MATSACLCGAVLAVGCGHDSKHVTKPVVRTPHPPGHTQVTGAHLQKPLPAGFSTPGTTAPAPAPGLLEVHPLTQLRPAALRRAPQPAALVRRTALALVNQPVLTRVQPLLVSRAQLRSRLTLTVAAGRLPDSRAHAALFVLLGPAYRAQRLVQVRHGVAAAAVTLPASIGSGTWALGVEDLSGVHAAAHHQVRGTVVLDLGIFQVR